MAFGALWTRIFDDRIFPWIYDLVESRDRFFRAHRIAQLADARGRVLEIGIGSGLNLPHYPDHITELQATEPNPGMQRRLERRAAQLSRRCQRLDADGRTLPVEDASIDTVVTTLVLCSVADRVALLSEIRRVLKPDGRYLFLEHGLSPDPRVARWQHRLNPVQRVIGAGCELTYDAHAALPLGGLRADRLSHEYLPHVPRVLGYLHRGVARRA